MSDRNALRTLARCATQLRDVAGVHAPHRIYGECGHEHADADVAAGLAVRCGDFITCEAAFRQVICRNCCTSGGPAYYQTEECADWHDHAPGRPRCSTHAILERGIVMPDNTQTPADLASAAAHRVPGGPVTVPLADLLITILCARNYDTRLPHGSVPKDLWAALGGEARAFLDAQPEHFPGKGGRAKAPRTGDSGKAVPVPDPDWRRDAERAFRQARGVWGFRRGRTWVAVTAALDVAERQISGRGEVPGG